MGNGMIIITVGQTNRSTSYKEDIYKKTTY